MSYYLFLDDIRDPIDVKWIDIPAANWVIVRDYDNFRKTVNEKGIPTYISYDHDLSFEHYTEKDFQKFLVKDYSNLSHKTGYDCAKFMIEACLDNNLPHPTYSVHSMNPVGKENIKNLINSYNKSQKNV